MMALPTAHKGASRMPSIRQLWRALLDGVMVVVPLGAVLLLVLAILRRFCQDLRRLTAVANSLPFNGGK